MKLYPPGGAPRGARRLASEALGILSAVASQAPESAAYGLIAFAPLGAAFGPHATALALLGAVAANAVACLAGGGRLVSGPRASLSLLTAELAAGLVAVHAAGSAIAPTTLLALLALALGAAGLLQILFGLLRLGTIVKFTPHAVRIGLTSGVGMLLVATALPALAGRPFGSGLHGILATSLGGASVVGAASLAVYWAGTRWRLPLPPVLVALVAATLLGQGLHAAGWLQSLGSSLATPVLPTPWWAEHASGWPAAAELARPAVLARIGSFALTLAALCTLDTLLTASVVDGRLRTPRNANRELVAQGLANLASSAAGGLANSPSIPRTLALVSALPGRRLSVLAYAAALLALLVFTPGLLGLVPSSAIGGVLLAQGLQMLAPSLWKTPWQLWGGGRWSLGLDGGQRRLVADNWGVAVAVALTTVALGLGSAVLVGALFAVLLFVRSNVRDIVRRFRSGSARRSLKMRPPEQEAALRREGGRIAVLELEGPLFFGTADALRARLATLFAGVDTVILDLHQVGEVDATGARILLEVGEDWARAGKSLVAAEWTAGDPRRRGLEALAALDHAAGLQLADDTDQALEQAEDRLLESLDLTGGAGRVMALAETQLGSGLGAEELALLETRMERIRFAAGTVLFRAGDPGDAVFVSVSGQIGLRLPGSRRRLASFAPGVTLGEMAVLSGLPRSAEAVAETEVQALRLPVAAFERLKAEHPALAARLLNNIALHLAQRVRALTTELSDWVTRSAQGRGALPFDAEG